MALRRLRWVWLVVLASFIGSGHALAANAEPSSGTDTSARPTAAFLNINDLPFGLLLEQRVLANSKAVWLERTAIAAIQREHQLQSLLGAGAVDGRAKIGKLLKADLLVLLATSTNPRGVSLVVCETSYGLRLAAHAVSLGDKPESDVAVLGALINRAIERHREKIVEIVAVPPFINHDLSYEYNYLQGAYAKLVEQTLGDRPGLLMVELAEARAIARELATAGTEATLRRPMPIYLLGEFRHEGKGEESRVAVRLQAFRGEEKLAKRWATLRSAEAPAFLQKATRELVAAGAETPRKLPDPREEARQLTERAAEFQRLGQWEESLALIEAALLLEPSEQRHYRAVVACSHLTTHYAYWVHPTAEDKKLGRQYCLRGLEHLEEFFRTAGKLDNNMFGGPRNYVYCYPTSDFDMYLKDSSQPDAVAAVEKEREILLRILRKRVRDGYDDEGWIIAVLGRELSTKEYFDLMYRLLVEFQDLPGLHDRIWRYALKQSGFNVYKGPEGEAFIVRLERSENPALRGGGAWLRWRRGLDKPLERDHRVLADPRPIPDSQAAHFAPIQFPVIAGAGKGRTISGLLSCTAAGPRRDIAWDRNHVYAIESKDGLKELWSTDDTNAIVLCVVFDGRYAWAAVFNFRDRRDRPRLLVLDPEQEMVREITKEDGLPLQAKENVPAFSEQRLMVAPLSPGRACVADGFGRSWIALVTYDPKAAKPVSVDVFHEARHTWDGTAGFAMDPGAVFQPDSMVLLTDKPAADPSAQRRILIGRWDGGHSAIGGHPLLVDPELRSVSVVSPGTFTSFVAGMPSQLRSFCVHQGAVYLFDIEFPRPVPHLYRIGFPELKPVIFGSDLPEGCLVSGDDGLHIVGLKWWRLRADGRLDDMGIVPWGYRERFAGKSTRWVKVDRDAPKEARPLLCEICRSRYYGFLAVTENGTYQVSFREEKLVPAVPHPDEDSRQKEEFDKTVAELTEAIRQNPQDAKGYNRRALAYLRGHQFAKGIADATEAIRLDPRSAEARNTRGALHLGAGDGDRAIADFTEAIRLDSKYAASYNNRGVVRFNKGDLDGAMADFSEAVRIDPKYAEAYFDRAGVWKRKGDLDRAIADYTEAIRNNPKYQNAYNSRGGAYERKGDFQRAQADRGEGMYLAAVEYARQGNLEKGAECLTGAINYNPKDARAYYQRGRLREKTGDAKGAGADLAEAARLDPSYATPQPTPKSNAGAPASSGNIPANAPPQ